MYTLTLLKRRAIGRIGDPSRNLQRIRLRHRRAVRHAVHGSFEVAERRWRGRCQVTVMVTGPRVVERPPESMATTVTACVPRESVAAE